MLQPWILASKLEPPAPPTHEVRRAALAACEAPVVVLEAGPGYGKTLGLLELARPAIDAGTPVVWLTLEEGDGPQLFHYLVAGVRRTIPHFGQELAALVGAETPTRVLWQHFLAELAAFNQAWVLVLDDVHHLAGDVDPLRDLAPLLDKLPAGLRLLIASRRRFPVALGKAIARGAVRVLGHDDLAFTQAEAAGLLARRAPSRAGDPAWQARARELDGWPLGLDFLAAAPEDAVVGRPGAAAAAESLAAYVAEEVYQALPPALGRAALQIACLQELTPEGCREIFAMPDAADVLQRLEEQHVVRRMGAGVVYRMPAHVRAFLAVEAERTVPAADRAGWQRRAAAYHQARGQGELAIPHLLAAGAWEEAGAACAASFPRMRYDGRQAQIARWLRAFPPAALERDAWLALWQGHVLDRPAGRAARLTTYARAQQLFLQAGDLAGAAKALVCRCDLMSLGEDAPAYQAALREAGELEVHALAEDRADLALIRGRTAESRGDLETMRRCNEAALAVPIGDSQDVAATHCIALFNMFTYALHKGLLGEARRAIDRVVQTAGQYGFLPLLLFGRTMRAHLMLVTGEVGEAAAELEGLPSGWRELLDWQELALALVIHGHLAQARGSWKEAEQALSEALAIFRAHDHGEGVKVPLERQLWLALARGQYARLDQLVVEAGTEPGETIYDHAMALPLARARHLEGLPGRARALLAEALPALERLEARSMLAHGRLFEAAAAKAEGDMAGAHEALTAALGLIEAHDYVFLLGQDAALWEELDPLLVALRPRFPFLERVPGMAARLAPAPVPAPTPATVVLDVAPGIPVAPADAAPAPRQDGTLAMRCFGDFEVRVHGVLLDQWPRRKAKLALAALALYPRGLSLAELAEVLGDEEVDNLTTYKVAISTLRRQLEPEMEKAGNYACVKLQGERYQLAKEAIALLDVRAFERALDDGNHIWLEEPERAAASYRTALELYRGHLFDEPYMLRFFESEREAMRQRALAAFLRLAAHPRVPPSEASKLLTRATTLFPADEDLCIALMRHMDGLGEAERGRQAYWDCRRALKAQLAALPGPELEQAYRGLRQGTAARAR